MKAKKHTVFGRTVTYEQVADALGMNVQTLRTLCKKVTGGDLEMYLNKRGIRKDNFLEVLDGTMIAAEEDKTGSDSEEHKDKPTQNEGTEMVMRAMFGDDYENDNQKEENTMTNDEQIEHIDDKKSDEYSSARGQLMFLNYTIDNLEGIMNIVRPSNAGDELKSEIERCSVKLETLLDEFRIERFGSLIDWKLIAEHMGAVKNESHTDLRTE